LGRQLGGATDPVATFGVLPLEFVSRGASFISDFVLAQFTAIYRNLPRSSKSTIWNAGEFLRIRGACPMPVQRGE
jgi:hypothetical protein